MEKELLPQFVFGASSNLGNGIYNIVGIGHFNTLFLTLLKNTFYKTLLFQATKDMYIYLYKMVSWFFPFIYHIYFFFSHCFFDHWKFCSITHLDVCPLMKFFFIFARISKPLLNYCTWYSLWGYYLSSFGFTLQPWFMVYSGYN